VSEAEWSDGFRLKLSIDAGSVIDSNPVVEITLSPIFFGCESGPEETLRSKTQFEKPDWLIDLTVINVRWSHFANASFSLDDL
jgi:hypothetical protein